tara:strand:+ start:754 stop:1314 length:561 start_codon:yes stop_codon:yes gene_type:complete
LFKYKTQTLKPNRAWTDDNGIQHPSNWHLWSKEEKEAIGLVEIISQTPPDSRLYTWTQNSDGTITSKAKKLDDTNEVDKNGDPLLDEKGNQVVTLGLKSQLILEVKNQQGSLLSQTDWTVVRKSDTGTAIPNNIATWRDAIRTKATEMETAIDNAADTDAIASLFLSWDEEGNKSGILYDWPILVE